MNTRNLRVDHDKLYYLLLCILVLSNVTQFSQVLNRIFAGTYSLITIVAFVCLLGVIFTAKISKKQFIAMVVVGGIGAYIYLFRGRSLFLFAGFLCIFAKNKNIAKIRDIFIYVLGTVFLFNILCTGYFAVFDRGSLYIRHAYNAFRPQLDLSCGGHPNCAARYYVMLVLLLLHKYWRVINKLHWEVLLALSCIFYYLVGSEAIFILIFPFLFWLLGDKKIVKKIVSHFLRYGVIWALIVSLICLWAPYLPVINSFVAWLNAISSGRFMLSERALSFYSLTLFGADAVFGRINMAGGQEVYIYVDNAYVYMLLNQGIVYLIGLQYILYRCSRFMNYKDMVIVVALLLYGMAESSMVSYITFFPIILCAEKIYARYSMTGVE